MPSVRTTLAGQADSPYFHRPCHLPGLPLRLAMPNPRAETLVSGVTGCRALRGPYEEGTPMSPPGDSATEPLLRQAGQGDAAARDELLARPRPRLRAAVAVRLDRRLAPRVDPSDVVQETLAEAARRLDDFLRDRPL